VVQSGGFGSALFAAWAQPATLGRPLQPLTERGNSGDRGVVAVAGCDPMSAVAKQDPERYWHALRAVQPGYTYSGFHLMPPKR
jgi:hypothetical protein